MRNKTVQVILTKDVQNLGKQGKLLKVKPGYVRNYLIPLKKAKIATSHLIDQFNLHQKELEIKQIQFIDKCLIVKKSLENLEKLTIKKKISESGVFFGKITQKQILDLINDQVNLKMELTKNQLQLPEMKELGDYIFEIVLATNVIAKIKIEILPE
uniref:50S ribosomal protein L9 n=1 Tax=Desmarestia aculeata TaxID=62298 RepID=UPI002E784CFD|nr:50S ribosomal protein L9 [Desmarestia aculeata]WAM62974.1 50S ribosomal protein L9 [Desmarestia aculeata]